ncbi:MAG: hypothetical protein QOE11_2800 [Solirubrobacteraceae bacterium]|nr:hypothetical protein [Solirubrobacteraceae bacterium]
MLDDETTPGEPEDPAAAARAAILAAMDGSTLAEAEAAKEQETADQE